MSSSREDRWTGPLLTAVESEGCVLSYTGHPPLGCAIASDSQLQRTQAKLICNLQKEKKKHGRGDQTEGLQKTVKLCSVSPLMHAVFNLLCASWRLRECVRSTERIVLRNDRVAATSELSLEIQDIDFT